MCTCTDFILLLSPGVLYLVLYEPHLQDYSRCNENIPAAESTLLNLEESPKCEAIEQVDA